MAEKLKVFAPNPNEETRPVEAACRRCNGASARLDHTKTVNLGQIGARQGKGVALAQAMRTFAHEPRRTAPRHARRARKRDSEYESRRILWLMLRRAKLAPIACGRQGQGGVVVTAP